MAINKKLIHFLKKENFENEVANGNILDNSIVFIKDTKEIWTHGTYYGSDVEVLNLTIDEEELEEVLYKGGSIRIDTVTLEDFNRLHNSKFSIVLINYGLILPLGTKLDDNLFYYKQECGDGNIYAVYIDLYKSDDVVLTDVNVRLEPIHQIPNIEFNIRDVQDIQSIKSLSTHTNAIYYYRIGGNDTVYLDTEDILLSLFLNGNDGAVETLYKTKEAYYKIGETWYSQNLSNYINFPKLHLKTCKGGDLISVTKHEVLASDFYSKFIDFNSISLELDTLLRASFEAFKLAERQSHASDGEFIKYLICSNKIYSALGNPNSGEPVYPLAVDGLVTYYEFHIMPNTENMYNGKFWTGNMTGPGIYSYVNAGLPEDTDEGEYYIGYVSPDGALTLISMKNPNKVFTRPDINSTWVKLENSNTFPSRSGWLLNVDDCLDNGVYPTCDTASLGLDLDWQNQYTTVVVQRTSTEDNGGYHTIEQTAYGRGNDEGRIIKRIIFYNPNTNNKQYGQWYAITYKGSGSYSTAVGYVAKATGINSTALGPAASAHGDFSISFGCEAEATADNSMALGSTAKAMGERSIALGGAASGSSSMALGDSANANQSYSMALGYWAETTGYGSTALGSNAIASGESSTALGNGADASGSFSLASGAYSKATGDYSTALGTFNNPHFTENDDSATSLFTLGKGTYINGNETRANALEIMKNNDIWFGEYNTGLKVYDGATNTTPFIERKAGETSKVVLGNGDLAKIDELGVGMALEADHAVSADIADKAEKLATPRKIGLTGGAVGTGTNFDGSASINIPVTALYDTPLAYKTLSDRNTEAKGLTLMDAVNGQFTANRLAFKRPDNILIEYSNDGGVNWNISSHTDETKVKLVSGIGTNLYLGNKTTGQTIQDKLRITIFAAKDGLDFYSTWQRLYVYLGTNGAEGLHCTYEYSLRDTPDNWVSQGDWRMVGWSGWNKLSYAGGTSFGGKNSSAHPFAIRLTFWFVGHADGYENKTSTCIYKLELRGTTVYGNYTGCKLAETGHMYDYDWQKNVTFPANVAASKFITKDGTADQVVLGDGTLKNLSDITTANLFETNLDEDFPNDIFIMPEKDIYPNNPYIRFRSSTDNTSRIEVSSGGPSEVEYNSASIHSDYLYNGLHASVYKENGSSNAIWLTTDYNFEDESLCAYLSFANNEDENIRIFNGASDDYYYPQYGSSYILAPKFIKTNGTATQILMADGSVKEISEIGGVMSPEDKQALEELKQQMSNINLILESIIGNGVNDTLESIINS